MIARVAAAILALLLAIGIDPARGDAPGGRPAGKAADLVPVMKEDPPYPRSAFENRIEGHVAVVYDVTEFGTVDNARIVESTPPGIFDEVALEYVRQWLFRPPQVDGFPQPVFGVTTTLPFHLAGAQIGPKFRTRQPPVYPPIPASLGITGYCKVKQHIAADGTVDQVQILQAVPVGVFEKACTDAVKQWTYDPPGDHVQREVTCVINFRFHNQHPEETNFLKPDDWLKLSFTLQPNGRAKNIEVVDRSRPDLSGRHAIEQVYLTQFAPIIENGVAVEKPNQTILIHGDSTRSALTLNSRCWQAAMGREFDTALQNCNAALALEPRSPHILDSRGFVYLKMNRLDDAIADYTAALQADPRQAFSLYGRGQAEKQKGDSAAGDADLAAAARIDSEIAERFGKP